MKFDLKFVLVIFIITVLYVVLKIVDMHFVIPESQSVNGNLFLIQDKSVKNDYVIFKYNKIDYKTYHKGKLFIKKIGCNSGQHLIVKDYQAICDGRIIATMFKLNDEGNKLPKYEYDAIIPNDKFFALGENLKSFDSRYFGLVDKNQIVSSARRIF